MNYMGVAMKNKNELNKFSGTLYLFTVSTNLYYIVQNVVESMQRLISRMDADTSLSLFPHPRSLWTARSEEQKSQEGWKSEHNAAFAKSRPMHTRTPVLPLDGHAGGGGGILMDFRF